MSPAATPDPSAALAPFLDSELPPMAARALARILILLFGVVSIAAFVVEVPETVSAPFVVAAVTGSDPIRTLHEGTIAEVHVVDAQVVWAGETLFVLASEPVGDRQAERTQIERQLGGTDERLDNERRGYQSQRRADEAELARLEARLLNLARQLQLKQQQLALAREVAARSQRGYDEGVASWIQSSGPKLDADRLAVDVEQSKTDSADTSSAIEKLRFEMEARHVTLRETERSVRQDADVARARKAALDATTPHANTRLPVNAPCSGTIVKLNVRAPGAVVNPGDGLAEIVCDEAELQVEIEVPQLGMALIREGQAVRLFYDAFPYQRYGARQATLRWVSPASLVGVKGPFFRALADLKDATVSVQGERRPVMAGMAGRAAIVVGRRSLASYAFEPIRQVRENLADADR